MFNPGLSIGQTLKNSDIVDIFKCGNMGGMRRSTLLLVKADLLRRSGQFERLITELKLPTKKFAVAP